MTSAWPSQCDVLLCALFLLLLLPLSPSIKALTSNILPSKSVGILLKRTHTSHKPTHDYYSSTHPFPSRSTVVQHFAPCVIGSSLICAVYSVLHPYTLTLPLPPEALLVCYRSAPLSFLSFRSLSLSLTQPPLLKPQPNNASSKSLDPSCLPSPVLQPPVHRMPPLHSPKSRLRS